MGVQGAVAEGGFRATDGGAEQEARGEGEDGEEGEASGKGHLKAGVWV